MSKKELLKEIEEKELLKYFSDAGKQALLKILKEEAPASTSKGITEKGIKILEAMAEEGIGSEMTSKVIGEKIFLSARSVSGSMRKLLTDGYVEKRGNNPISYAITERGITVAKGDNIDK